MHGGGAPQVKRAAARRVADMLADAIDPNRVLREAGRLAYSDVRELYDDAGNLLPIKQWPDDIARCVASIEQERITGNADKGDGQLDQILKTKVRLWDKVSKLGNLMRMHGHLTEKHEVTVNVNLTARLAEGRKRVAALRGAQGVVVEGESKLLGAGAAVADRDGSRG